MPAGFKYVPSIASVNGVSVLRRLSSQSWRRDKANLETMKAFNGATEEVDRLGDIGLTVVFKKLTVLNDNDAFLSGGTGEVYVIASTLDGSGEQTDFRTQLFEGIDDGEDLPLGSGGLLVAYRRNPKWFLDVHMVVMESDSDLRNLGASIQKAREAAKLDEISKAIGAASVFDPTKISLAVQGVNLFLDTLVAILGANGDDHIATIHDFYLKQQAFGAGLHPLGRATTRYQGVNAQYEIQLSSL